MEYIKQPICEKRSYLREYTSHEHPHGQFLFPLQGTLDIRTKEQKLQLNADHFLYLPPQLEHLYRSKDKNECLVLDVPFELLPENTTSMSTPLDRQWGAIRYLLLEESRSGNNHSSLVALTRYVTDKLQMSRPASIEYIHHHFKEPIRLETLASLEHYHPVYYSTWFKRQTGKSVKDYINELRLNEAKYLLNSTTWLMTRISEEIGFSNSSSFSRWFVSHEGISPNNYRKLN